MQANSLWFRLIASSSLIALTLLASAAILLNAIFVTALQHNFDQRLRAALDGILANVEVASDKTLRLQSQVADARFVLPLSGWYWQITEPGGGTRLLTSASLLEQQLTPPAGSALKPDVEGISAYSLTDAQGTNLRAITQDVKLFGGDKTYNFTVAGNFDELKDEVSSFQRTLLAVLVALGLALLAGLAVQVRFTLKPLSDMRHQLNDIRSGRAEFLGDNFPRELQPVADELNLLVEANLEIVDRARMQVGNLAHALKTPISVLNNEARDTKVPLAAKVKEQIEVMRDQVNLYLDRARRAARAQTIGAATDVEPVLQGLARTLERINRDRGLKIDIDMPLALKFRGERQDLEEMVGNLMDNACKWASHQIVVHAQGVTGGSDESRSWLTIMVDDDGPGIPAENRSTALERGKRLDESKPGSGLGMSIISETAAMYSGTIALDKADLGGLRAILRLPRVI
ncbi:sensor histidine kinase [Aestuariivirga litoralis]|uniref:sensor histidine kinase n=1 Tax=Aestuariivirga litoralis TaxID=2650924 RepID=UPI0018C7E25D|nr:sensor histidine kinase [Aestuariivirga litoralis]MBG1232221.1 sensor histidine kinase [Aestuariivirga litoralis]